MRRDAKGRFVSERDEAPVLRPIKTWHAHALVFVVAVIVHLKLHYVVLVLAPLAWLAVHHPRAASLVLSAFIRGLFRR